MDLDLERRGEVSGTEIQGKGGWGLLVRQVALASALRAPRGAPARCERAALRLGTVV